RRQLAQTVAADHGRWWTGCREVQTKERDFCRVRYPQHSCLGQPWRSAADEVAAGEMPKRRSLVPGIVGGVDVGDLERPDDVDLHDGCSSWQLAALRLGVGASQALRAESSYWR